MSRRGPKRVGSRTQRQKKEQSDGQRSYPMPPEFASPECEPSGDIQTSCRRSFRRVARGSVGKPGIGGDHGGKDRGTLHECGYPEHVVRCPIRSGDRCHATGFDQCRVGCDRRGRLFRYLCDFCKRFDTVNSFRIFLGYFKPEQYPDNPVHTLHSSGRCKGIAILCEPAVRQYPKWHTIHFPAQPDHSDLRGCPRAIDRPVARVWHGSAGGMPWANLWRRPARGFVSRRACCPCGLIAIDRSSGVLRRNNAAADVSGWSHPCIAQTRQTFRWDCAGFHPHTRCRP